MRLWHQQLIPMLPRQQLLGQHRECCALRGKGWGKKHETVDYVFEHSIEYLVAYHLYIISEMTVRGFNVDGKWLVSTYRGKQIGLDLRVKKWVSSSIFHEVLRTGVAVYQEHNDQYLQERVENLQSKGCVCRFLEENQLWKELNKNDKN